MTLDVVSRPSGDYQFNYCDSLAKLSCPIAWTKFQRMGWDSIVSYMGKFFNKQISEEKDTFGFSISGFRAAERTDLFIALAKKNRKDAYTAVQIDRIMKKIPEPVGFSISVRRSEFLKEVQSVILDYDDPQNDESSHIYIKNRLNSLGISHLMYSSYSNTPQCKKYRVVIPYAFPCNKDTHKTASAFLVHLLDTSDYKTIRSGALDITCLEPTRFFYVPNNRPNNTGRFFLNTNTGTFFDPNKALLIVDILRHDHRRVLSLKDLKKISPKIKKEKNA
jgi:hypothetical protein